MTKADLKRLDELYELTGDALDRLSGLRATYGLSGCNFSGVGHGGAVGCPTEDTAIAIEAVEQEIEQHNVEMRRIIRTVGKERMRQILEFKYIKRLSWSRVTDRLGLVDDRELRRSFGKFKKSLE